MYVYIYYRYICTYLVIDTSNCELNGRLRGNVATDRVVRFPRLRYDIFVVSEKYKKKRKENSRKFSERHILSKHLRNSGHFDKLRKIKSVPPNPLWKHTHGHFYLFSVTTVKVKTTLTTLYQRIAFAFGIFRRFQMLVLLYLYVCNTYMYLHIYNMKSIIKFRFRSTFVVIFLVIIKYVQMQNVAKT